MLLVFRLEKRQVDLIEQNEQKNETMNYNSTNISTGYPTLDDLIHDFWNAHLIIIGSRPTIGKSSFALSIAKNIAIDQELPTAFFSMESSSAWLSMRIACNISQLDIKKVSQGLLREDEKQLYKQALEKIDISPLYLDDSPALSVPEFKIKASQMVNNYGVRFFFIDYLQLMNTGRDINYQKKDSSELNEVYRKEITEITKCLEQIAKEFSITIFVCSQLRRRKVNGWRKPCLSQFEDKTICKHSDMIVLIHRPEYYCIMTTESKECNKRGRAEIMVKRNKLGNNGSLLLGFDTSACCFYNL